MTIVGRTITIDPGHGEIFQGANDPGAVNQALRINERDTVRRQADLLTKLLRDAGARVKLIENGSTKSLAQLGAEANGTSALVSLHLNAFNGKAQGHEVVIDPLSSAADEKLANHINREMGKTLTITNRGVKKQKLGVLRGAPLTIPAVLVESFFIDSVKSTAELETLLNQATKGIFNGLKAFF